MRQAFSLLEVMLAVALSALIALIGFAAFRYAAQALALLTRLTRENTQLRAGMITALADADFWHSEANPAFPYGRAYNAFRHVDINGNRLADDAHTRPSGDATYRAANNGNNRRLFRRVDFRADLDGATSTPAAGACDPGWMLPHDPRGWYRNHIHPNPRPIQVWQERRGSDASIAASSATNNNLNSNWDVTGNIYEKLPPAAVTPRHLVGDYAAAAHAGYPGNDLRGARAVLMEKVLAELGVVGLSAYLPPGQMHLWLRPTSNLYRTYASDAERQANNFNKGELPWQLDLPEIKSSVDYNPSTASGPANPGRLWVVSGQENPQLGRWLTTAEIAAQNADLPAAVRHYNRLDLASELTIWQLYWAKDLGMALAQRALLYGVRPSGDPDPALRWTIVHATARRGLSPDILGIAGGRITAATVASTLVEPYRNETWLAPVSLSGTEPELSEAVDDIANLRYQVYRYRYQGSDVCAATVRIQDAAGGGRMADIAFTVLGTTYRGARQHWAVTTRGQRLDPATHRLVAGTAGEPAMGDYYAP